MKGSGIENLLQVIYASNTIDHILSCKVVSRVVRGHCIVDASLHSLLAAKVIGVTLPAENTDTDRSMESEDVATTSTDDATKDAESLSTEVNQSHDVQNLADLMNQLLSGETSTDDIEQNCIVSKTLANMSCEERNLSSTETASLWFQYMQMVDLLRKFIKTERLGDWDIHLQSLYEMLPFFAASGHRFYLKSVHIYLQRMAILPEQHPEIHRPFREGLHVLRQYDRCWSGLSPDLVIEQCLMRSLNTTGGLTRGRGFSEPQRLLWVLSMPACVAINSSMQQLTNVKYSTGEQHKEATYA